MNRLGPIFALTALLAAAGCGGSGQDEVERSVQRQLQQAIDADDASGRTVGHVTCFDDKPFCVARVRTRTGERFTAVQIRTAGDDVAIGQRVDQGVVRPGPPEEGLKRDVQTMLADSGERGEVTEVSCDRETWQCSARIADGDGRRSLGLLVVIDDSEDYSLVTTFDE